ncbi:MAG: TlpA disulfide reductase family protein [Actinomycetota bacterium]|nr:TlpA disulfide reductase family protein [Actinomycetota bacterium]
MTTADAPVAGRTRHTARWAATAVLVVVAGLVAVLATRPPATATEVSSPLVGEQAPPLAGTTVTGAPFRLPAAPGHYVVVNFFASWCSSCQVEEPELVKFAFEHRSGDVSLVGVVFEDTPAAVRAYQRSQGATWPVLADPGGAIALQYGVRAPPSTFVVAPDGRVVAFLVAPETAAGLDAIIHRAEAGSP